MRKTILYLLLALAFISFLVLHFYVPRIITQIKLPPFHHFAKKAGLTDNQDTTIKEFTFLSKDGFNLSADLVRSKSEHSKGTLIFLHGIRSHKGQFASLAKSMADFGYNSIALDLRAHGESEGTHCTFGVKEKEDVTQLISYLNENEDISDNYGVWGMSLGGAVALQCLAHDSRIKFGIVECTFSDFHHVATDYFESKLGFSLPVLSDYIINRSCEIAEFNSEEASPRIISPQIKQPILIFHGTADANINIESGKQNFDLLASEQKFWVPLEGGTHHNMAAADPDKYLSHITKFLHNHAE